MNKIVNCKLEIISYIDKMKDTSIIEGKGYYKKDDNKIVVYFSNENSKCKYEYENNVLTIYFNDSKYIFKNKKRSVGQIKNGDYVFEITTFANKLEINNNSILLDYTLFQNNIELGKYITSLFF